MISIFIKGCREQLHWLCYNLQLLEKNWQEPPPEIVVMLDSDCQEVIKTWGPFRQVTYLYSEPWPDRYMHALWTKATADYWTRGDPILLLDCDTILMEKASLADFMCVDRIKLPYLPWDRADANARKLWPGVVAKSTGLILPVDYMVSRPWLFWRSTFAGARKLAEAHQDKSFYAAVYSEAFFDWTQYLRHPFTFCDIETLGIYAGSFEAQRYQTIDLASGEWPLKVKDYWSHTEFDLVEAELTQALKQ